MATVLQEAARVSAFDSEQRNIPVFRSPPHNFEAEKALLGALLANNNAYDRVSDFLTAEHFADGVHGRIYDAMRRLIERGQVADPITLKMLFEQDGTLAEVGGPRYLAELAASMVSIINATDYARLIYDLFLKRQLIDIGEQVVNSAYEPEQAAEEQIAEAEDRLYKLAETGEFDTGFKPFVTSMREAVEAAQMARNRDGQLSGVGSGFRDLDNLLGGLHRSDLIILAARPSMGKTALATNIAFNAAQSYRAETGPDGKLHTVNGAVVGFFSL
jgi:replicative DNA helicase